MTIAMPVLTFANMAATLVFAIWALFALRRWARSPRGKEAVSTWSPGLVLPAQTAIALLWWEALLDMPWTGYVLYQFMGDWSVVLVRLLLVFLLLLLPGGLLILDAAWMRLHRMPSQWTLDRIWKITGLLFLSCFILGYVFRSELLDAGLGVVLVFAFVSTAFLTAWWVVSHPVIAD